MRCIKLFFVCFIILSCNCYSQESPSDISTKDSIKNSNSIHKDELQFKNFFRSTSKKLLGKDDLLGLQLYEKTISDSLFIIYPNNLNLDNLSKEELAYFKETFQQLMETAKRNHYRYDLGEVGRYLGISRNILAIILAIISVAK
jgi:hypothetical protein